MRASHRHLPDTSLHGEGRYDGGTCGLTIQRKKGKVPGLSSEFLCQHDGSEVKKYGKYFLLSNKHHQVASQGERSHLRNRCKMKIL